MTKKISIIWARVKIMNIFYSSYDCILLSLHVNYYRFFSIIEIEKATFSRSVVSDAFYDIIDLMGIFSSISAINWSCLFLSII